MEVAVTQSEDAAVATVAGEVDADNCKELGAQLLDGTAGARRLVVDLAGLSFIDSSGISELLRVAERARDRDQAFELRDPSPVVKRVLEITGLLDHFGLG
jgi:anti-anti-sigma factor